MSGKGDFGYGSTGGEYRDNPGTQSRQYRDNPFDNPLSRGGGYQGSGYNDFSELCDKVSSNIFKVNNSATSLDRAIKQIGTSRDSRQLRDKIHDTEQDTNRVIGDTTKTFKQLSASFSRADRQQKLQYERLMGEFQETVQRYSSLQKKVAEKVKATPPLTSPKHTESKDLINWGDDDDRARLLEEQEKARAQLQQQGEVIDTDLALIQEREENIRQLEADILDINEIFRDLATLVHEQGEMINNIEDNVETAYNQVESGNTELEKAAKYQRKARKKMCIFVVILVIIAAILAIILATTIKK